MALAASWSIRSIPVRGKYGIQRAKLEQVRIALTRDHIGREPLACDTWVEGVGIFVDPMRPLHAMVAATDG